MNALRRQPFAHRSATRCGRIPSRRRAQVCRRQQAADRGAERPGARRPGRPTARRRSASSHMPCASTRTAGGFARTRRWPASCWASSPRTARVATAWSRPASPSLPVPGNATADAGGNAPLPQTGGSVQLTIDASLQLRLEKELSAAYIADRAPRVSGVVHGPVHRRDPGLGFRAWLRRERLRDSCRRTIRPSSPTRSSARSTSPAR